MDWNWTLLLLSVVIMAIAKTGFGGSLGILAMPIMAAAIGAREAVGTMLPLLCLTDVVGLCYYWRAWRTRSVLPFLPGAAIGIMLGSLLLNDIPEEQLRHFIGAAALAFMVLHTSGKADWLKEKSWGANWQVGFVAGILTGIISTLAHVGGLVTTMYLLPLGLSNRMFVATATMIFLVVNFLKVTPYLAMDLIQADSLMTGVYLLPGIAIGAVIGFYLNRKTPPVWFNRIILIGITLSAVHLLFF
jgi:uncharacterized protein